MGGYPPTLDPKVTILGNLQWGKSGRAIFVTQNFGSQTPPPPPLSLACHGAVAFAFLSSMVGNVP